MFKKPIDFQMVWEDFDGGTSTDSLNAAPTTAISVKGGTSRSQSISIRYGYCYLFPQRFW